MLSQQSKSGAGWVVLLVDDTPDNLVVAQTALSFHGAEVHTAGSGQQALKLLEQITPTVILLDIRMPDMDGWALYDAMRNNPCCATVPIIAITAYAMEADRERMMKHGFDGYISKPFDVMRIVDDIRGILSVRK